MYPRLCAPPIFVGAHRNTLRPPSYNCRVPPLARGDSELRWDDLTPTSFPDTRFLGLFTLPHSFVYGGTSGTSLLNEGTSETSLVNRGLPEASGMPRSPPS